MNITTIVYTFHNNEVIVKVPFEITRETTKCYFTKSGYRYLKDKIGKPYLKSAAYYPYLELVMVDADEEILRDELSKWFMKRAHQLWKVAENEVDNEF